MADKAKSPRPQVAKPSKEEATQLPRILVSSVVYGYEDLLESIYALLENLGYEVLMSHKGTIPINPNISAMTSCVDAVDGCDVFLGIILPHYGTGREEGNPHSVTHREAMRAIEQNKPRWFLVHEHVVIARELLKPYRLKKEVEPGRFEDVKPWQLKPGIEFEKTPILSDLRVLDLYELAMRHDIPMVKDRKGNWVQAYGPEEDARLFAIAQFRRHKEVMQHLRKLSDPEVASKKGGKR